MNEYFKSLNKYVISEEMNLLEQYAKINDIPIINKESLSFLLLLIETNNITKILEIGTAIGYSAINMALLNPNIYIDTIEKKEEMCNLAYKNICLFGLNERINLICDDALNLDINVLKEEYDLIFIDAAKAQNINFFNKYEMKLSKKGIIVTDNLFFHGILFKKDLSKNLRGLSKKIKLYNEFLSNNNNFKTYFIPVGDGMSVSIRRYND